MGFKTWLEGRIYGVTAELRMGMFPARTILGDNISAFAGASTPHVIRLRVAGGYKFVGECYVDGLMYDEVCYLPNFEEIFVEISLH